MNDRIVDPHGLPREDVFVLNLPVGMSALEEGRLALLAHLQPFDLDERLMNRVEVVLEELVSNVVRHAQDADSLTIEAERAGTGVLLSVEDNGAAFNPLEVPEPAPFATLEDAMLGGQGIPLIRRLSKSVTYRRSGACNRVSALVGG